MMAFRQVLCKNFTKNGDPINITNKFSPTDMFIVSLAILDNLETNKEINLQVTWKFQSAIIYQNSQRFLIDHSTNHHRFESFIKMAYIEYRNLYGQWNVSVSVDEKEHCNQNFIILRKPLNYGNNLKNNYVSKNSLINVSC